VSECYLVGAGGKKFASGTFTGNGTTTQSVSGLGFKPKVVTLNWYRNGGNSGWALISAIHDEAKGIYYSQTMAGANDSESLDVITVNTDGFTVTSPSGSFPITSGVGNYYWTAEAD